jgi:phosphosulfolactate synthase (CoM biosynthesis protein A)
VAPFIGYAVPLRLLVRKDQVELAIDLLREFDFSFTFGGLSNTDENNAIDE